MGLVHLKTVSFFLLNLFVVSSSSSILTEAAIATEILEQAVARTQTASVVPSETQTPGPGPTLSPTALPLLDQMATAHPGLWTAR